MGTARLPLYSAGLMLAAAAVLAGCSSGSGSSAGSHGTTGSAGSPAAAGTPQEVMKLAAKTASGANSFTGTMDLRTTPKPGSSAGSSGSPALGNVSMSATFAERIRPSVLASVNIGKLSAGAQSLPGGFREIVTPSTLYLTGSFLTSTLHLSKPWLAIPLSAASNKSGVNFAQIFSQLQSNGPLTDTQLLAAATSVRQVGTGTVGGVPVTEYTGTLPLAKGLSHLSGRVKAQAQQALTTAGITTAKFTVWIDGQHLVRKSVITESGKSMTEVVTTTITSINQPVSVTVPPASQTTSMPSSALGPASGT